MAEKKLGLSSFDLNIKFKDREEAYLYAKRLVEFVRYTCKRNANKGWSAQIMVCISNTKGNTTYVHFEHSDKVGRPKKVKEVCLLYKDDYLELDWHLHILLVSKPLYAFRDEIKRYIDRNWFELSMKKEEDNSKVYKKDTNIKIMEYFINQADNIFFGNYNYTKEDIIPDGYSLKDLYNSYMKMMTARKYAKSIGNKKRLALEDKYYNIMNFYWNITKEQDNKIVKKYMKEIQLIKIAENYERLGKSNKVQKDISLRRREISEDIGF